MLTQEQKDMLHKAIELAQKPGMCNYLIDGEPCCVIGQLGMLNSISIEDMRKWSGITVDDLYFSKNTNRNFQQLWDIDMILLVKLQKMWDHRDSSMIEFKNETELRKNMHEVVDNYIGYPYN